jgi:hypothetical protein
MSNVRPSRSLRLVRPIPESGRTEWHGRGRGGVSETHHFMRETLTSDERSNCNASRRRDESTSPFRPVVSADLEENERPI